jgi:hypothetical protein
MANQALASEIKATSFIERSNEGKRQGTIVFENFWERVQGLQPDQRTAARFAYGQPGAYEWVQVNIPTDVFGLDTMVLGDLRDFTTLVSLSQQHCHPIPALKKRHMTMYDTRDRKCRKMKSTSDNLERRDQATRTFTDLVNNMDMLMKP